MNDSTNIVALGICLTSVIFAIVISIMLLTGVIEVVININKKEDDPYIEGDDDVD
jgi:hypothetical protein